LDSGAASVAPIDQRAVVRPQGSAFDIGAYEASVALLANAMALRTDVSGDGLVTPLDALLVINRINQSGEGESMPSLREDVNGDGQVSPLDVLLVVNQLNSGATELTTRSTETETNQSVDLSMAQADVAQWLDDIRKKDAGWGLNSGDEELLLASLASHRLRSLTGD
jgi:hypothetical protein